MTTNLIPQSAVVVVNGVVRTTSIEVAKAFHKEHLKVLRCWNIGTYTLQLAFGSTIIRKYTANKQEALEYCKRELLKRAKK